MSNQSIQPGALITRIQIHAWRAFVFCVVALVATFGAITVVRAAATITATKTYALVIDPDGNSVASSGDTLEYTVTISNAPGTPIVDDAINLEFDDNPGTNTTFVPGSIKASPVAVDDLAYTAIGNVSISIPAGSGLLGNDFMGVNPVATITAFDATSVNTGTVVVNGDGSFTYNPPRGFEGQDTFTYTLSNATGSSIGTVRVTVGGMIWFIDKNSACASSCNGRLSHPYLTLAAFNAPGTDNVPTSTNVLSRGAAGINPYVLGSPAPALLSMSSQAITPAGGDQPHNNLQPYLTFYFCIAMQGVFPPRP